MTVWRSSGCNAENGYGIRRDRSVLQRVQKSHDSPSRYKGYLKSALVSGTSGWVTDIPERGARLRRRDDGEYREYAREEQRCQTGCPARNMSANCWSRTLASSTPVACHVRLASILRDTAAQRAAVRKRCCRIREGQCKKFPVASPQPPLLCPRPASGSAQREINRRSHSAAPAARSPSCRTPAGAACTDSGDSHDAERADRSLSEESPEARGESPASHRDERGLARISLGRGTPAGSEETERCVLAGSTDAGTECWRLGSDALMESALAAKARRPRISTVFEGGATQAASIHRSSNADGFSPRASRPDS